MKIYTAKQMAVVDAVTVQEQSITSFELMGRAARALLKTLLAKYRLTEQCFVLCCGKGNNGGDGLLLARYLNDYGASVVVYLWESEGYSVDNLRAQQQLPKSILRKFSLSDELTLPDGAIIIDCLFGYGLNRPLGSEWRGLIEQLNSAKNTVIAVDIPSGLLADGPTPKNAAVVRAQLVLTFQCPKMALLMPGNNDYLEDFEVLDIQLSAIATGDMEVAATFVTLDMIQTFYKRRKKFDHKGVFGHSLIWGGGYGKMGAVQLALKAALRSGCGLLSAYIPSCGYAVIQTAVPEAMVLTDSEPEVISSVPDLGKYQAIGIGIGMGTSVLTKKAFRELLFAAAGCALVLDADALNMLAEEPDLLNLVPAMSILTPHPKELERLIGKWDNDWDKITKARVFAAAYKVYVLIKGANSAMVLPDGRLYFNSTGNVGMATGGSGDVLTGVLTALRGQGYTAEEALLMGVYLHGRAADIAVKDIGLYSLIPSDVIAYLGKALLELEEG